MKFREESIFDHPRVPKLAPGPIKKKLAIEIGMDAILTAIQTRGGASFRPPRHLDSKVASTQPKVAFDHVATLTPTKGCFDPTKGRLPRGAPHGPLGPRGEFLEFRGAPQGPHGPTKKL